MENEIIKVLRVTPGEEIEIAEIKNTLKTLQHEVDGLVEAFYPFEDNMCILCNEEGRYNGMEPNRAVYDDEGVIMDIIFGPFLIVGLGEEDFESLTEEQLEKYTEMFRQPESFCIRNGQIVVTPFTPAF